MTVPGASPVDTLVLARGLMVHKFAIDELMTKLKILLRGVRLRAPARSHRAHHQPVPGVVAPNPAIYDVVVEYEQL
ncbi:MAG TPA: hypothetical protein VJT49_14335 [Amycolatopsis sp.]|nr:hypothetical protein [Amycolatopsis sp.]HKS46260.1 hypothetical protein [Amycolatopsis sp.]